MQYIPSSSCMGRCTKLITNVHESSTIHTQGYSLILQQPSICLFHAIIDIRHNYCIVPRVKIEYWLSSEHDCHLIWSRPGPEQGGVKRRDLQNDSSNSSCHGQNGRLGMHIYLLCYLPALIIPTITMSLLMHWWKIPATWSQQYISIITYWHHCQWPTVGVE